MFAEIGASNELKITPSEIVIYSCFEKYTIRKCWNSYGKERYGIYIISNVCWNRSKMTCSICKNLYLLVCKNFIYHLLLIQSGVFYKSCLYTDAIESCSFFQFNFLVFLVILHVCVLYFITIGVNDLFCTKVFMKNTCH